MPVLGAVIKIMARNDTKVMLSWAPFSEGVSHYTLERSFDGRHYEEAGVFFTGEWGNEPVYKYIDKLRRPYAGTVYYRLRVTGVDGTQAYTAASISPSN
jgi:hypothetical protein